MSKLGINILGELDQSKSSIKENKDTNQLKSTSTKFGAEINNLTKEELIRKLTEIKESHETEILEKDELLNEKNEEIREKTKILNHYSSQNKQLLDVISELKNDVENRIENIDTNKITDKVKSIQKESPAVDQLISLKNKELQNAYKMIDILQKDKKELKKNLNEKSQYTSVVNLEDKIKFLEKTISDQANEIKFLKEIADDHKSCVESKYQVEKIKKTLNDDILNLRTKNKEILNNWKVSEFKREKLMEAFDELKNDFDNLKSQKNMNQNKAKIAENNELKNESLNLSKLNVSQPLPKKNEEKNKIEKEAKISNNHNVDQDRVLLFQKRIDKDKMNNQNKILSAKNPEKLDIILPDINNSVNKNFNNKKHFTLKVKEYDEDHQKLFSDEEKKELLSIIPIETLEIFEKRFKSIEHAKFSIENRFKSESKIYLKKINELENQIQIMNLQLKESENKLKLLHYQIVEYKNESRIGGKKNKEYVKQIEILNQILKEKEYENQILYQQIHSMKNNYKLEQSQRKKTFDNEYDEDDEEN